MKIELKAYSKLQLQNIKKSIFPDIAEDGSVIVDYFIRIMFLLYPLFLIKDDIDSVLPSKIILFILLNLLSAVLYGSILFCKRACYSHRFLPMDAAMLFAAGLLAVKAVCRIWEHNMDLKQELLLIGLIGTYFLTRAVDKGYVYYLKLLLSSAAVLYTGLFAYYLLERISFLDVEEMVLQPEGLRSYLILTTCIGSLLYCLTGKGVSKKLYALMTVAGFILLLFDGDAVLVCLTGIFILCIPLVFTPTAELIKRNLTLLFLYLFLISNIPLLQVLEGFKVKHVFNMQNGWYIDVLLVLTGICIFVYWKKVPVNIPPEKIIMRRFRQFYKTVLAAGGAAVLACALNVTKAAAFPDIFGMKALKYFCASLGGSIDRNTSLFSVVLESYGVIGGGVLILLIILSARKLWKQLNATDATVKMLSMLAGLFLVQLFFYRFQTVSSPLYMILLTLALFSDPK